MKLLGIGILVTTLFKTLWKIIKAAVMAVAYVLLYFGLWVPFLYMLVALIPIIGYDLDITVMSTNSFIFYVGLVLSIIASIILTIRNLIVKPIKDIKSYKKRKSEYKARKELAKRRELYRNNPDKYYAIYGDVIPHTDSELLKLTNKNRDNLPTETPRIYRSDVNFDIIVHEYKEYFDVYRDMGDHIEYIERKPKPNKLKK